MNENEIQNTEATQEESQPSLKRYLFTVTPLSKYLAMAIFIILPFVGFLIGLNLNETRSIPVNFEALEEDLDMGEEKEISTSISEEDKTASLGLYEIKNNFVFYSDKEIINADAETFNVMQKNVRWAKDKGNVYYIGDALNVYDAETFEYLGNGYIRDKNGVYYGNLYGTPVSDPLFSNGVELIPEIDTDTFVVLGKFVGKDKNNVFNGANIIDGADTNTFKVIPSPFDLDDSAYFAKDSQNAYTYGYPSAVKLDVAVEDIEYLGQGFSVTSDKVYSGFRVVGGADSETFKVFKESFAIDKNNVYTRGGIQPFRILPVSYNEAIFVGHNVIKDNKNVFYLLDGEYVQMTGMDAETIEIVGRCYSLETYTSWYYQDKSNVYVNGKVIEPIDSKTFEFLGIHGSSEGLPHSTSYAKDKSNVYVGCGQVIEGADIETFIVLEDGYAQDKNKSYYFGKESDSLEPDVISEGDSKKSVMAEQYENSSTVLANCFVDGKTLGSTLDTATWATYEGFGFSTKYPEELIKIARLEVPSEENRNDVVEYSVMSNRDKSQSATIKVHRLLKDNYAAGYMHLPSVTYELNSNSWWTLNKFGWAVNEVLECSANSIGQTLDGNDIYLTSDGDVGYGFTNYFVVYRNVPDEYGHYEPLVIEFSATYVGDGYKEEYYEIQNELFDIVESMIKHLELGPTSKG